ncbi:MAG: DUF814 domain-containing protein [Desulfovibrionaceae bacterium]|jgi:hypothetical protein|nr:DUF814 domain-containing protein [Desulfovibrionaceae bacterium]
MEATFFHCLARELGPLVSGKRVEKIFGPAPGVFVLVLGARAFKRHLVLATGRGEGLLFLSDYKPANPPEPGATIMWLRKRLAGRRLLDPVWDRGSRRMAWSLTAGDGRFLVLDLEAGPQLVDELGPGFGAEPVWPELARVLEDPEVWRAHPHVSPPLRATLAALDPVRAAGLLRALERGSCGAPRVYLRDGEPVRGLAWALPEVLACGEEERVFETFLEAASFWGEAVVFPRTGAERRAGSGGAEDLTRARAKRVRRTLRKLEAERERLAVQAELEGAGRALQAALYGLDANARLHRAAGLGPDGAPVAVELDASLTVVENMARFFRLAARARRGLAALEARAAGLREELDGLADGTRTPPPRQERPGRSAGPRVRARTGPAVHRFRSDDGFLLLRGKNSAANHRMLGESASPFDYWFHAEDGPGAHLILKRDHPGQEVPRRTLEQAAVLAALKSWQDGSAKGRVMCALVKDVRKIKGAPQGAVHVDRVLHSLRVDMDPALEERLRVE